MSIRRYQPYISLSKNKRDVGGQKKGDKTRYLLVCMEKGTCCNGRISSIDLYTSQAAETACHLEISFQNKKNTVKENTERIFLGKNENRNKKRSERAGGLLFFKHVEKKLLF